MAKESFLDRLKRERSEAAAKTEQSSVVKSSDEPVNNKRFDDLNIPKPKQHIERSNKVQKFENQSFSDFDSAFNESKRNRFEISTPKPVKHFEKVVEFNQPKKNSICHFDSSFNDSKNEFKNKRKFEYEESYGSTKKARKQVAAKEPPVKLNVCESEQKRLLAMRQKKQAFGQKKQIIQAALNTVVWNIILIIYN